MNEAQALRMQLEKVKTEFASFQQAVANDHVNFAMQVFDGMTHVLRASQSNPQLRQTVSRFLMALEAAKSPIVIP